jgi:hypothetical protein
MYIYLTYSAFGDVQYLPHIPGKQGGFDLALLQARAVKGTGKCSTQQEARCNPQAQRQWLARWPMALILVDQVCMQCPQPPSSRGPHQVV